MSVYEQLISISQNITIVRSSVLVNNATTKQLVDVNDLRIYLAIATPPTGTSTLRITPIDVSAIGFPLLSSSFIEFWMEKHKSLVQQKWFANNVAAGPTTLEITEVIYQVPP